MTRLTRKKRKAQGSATTSPAVAATAVTATATMNEAEQAKGQAVDLSNYDQVPCWLFDLPFELLVLILSYLPAADLCKSATVCKAWLVASSSDFVWRDLCLSLGSSSATSTTETTAGGGLVLPPGLSNWKDAYRDWVAWSWSTTYASPRILLQHNNKQVSLDPTKGSGWATVFSEQCLSQNASKRVITVRFNQRGSPTVGSTALGFVPERTATERSATHSDISCKGWSLWSNGKMRRWPQDMISCETDQITGDSRYVSNLPEWKDGDEISMVIDLQDELWEGSLNFYINGRRVESGRARPSVTGITKLLAKQGGRAGVHLAMSTYPVEQSLTIIPPRPLSSLREEGV
ncbi:hypothetical protein QOT17_007478 [Balamuthia mandrillaris]